MDRMVVGLVADPGLCTNIAQGLAGDLPATLNEAIDHGTDWHVEVISEALPLDADGKVQVWKKSSRLKADKDWD